MTEISVIFGCRSGGGSSAFASFSLNLAFLASSRISDHPRDGSLASIKDELPRIERRLGKLSVTFKAGGTIEAVAEDITRQSGIADHGARNIAVYRS
ncbi:hypothetical protein ACE103_10240 [Bradyrhizobium sp. ma5]|uniref:hypothetical protein n=1 Tax=Bradyrhizobium sp. ma5 TaxID=3344828 RepID=UPI0035D45041